MKVVCVDDSRTPHDGECIHPNGYIVAGETYTVLEAFMAEYPSQNYAYELSEKPIFHRIMTTAQGGWAASRFVTLQYFQAEFCVKEETIEPATAGGVR